MTLRLVALIMLVCCVAGQSRGESGRPCVIGSAEDFRLLREDLRSCQWKREIYHGKHDLSPRFRTTREIKPDADRWLDRDIEIPARGGHYHHFFCECGNVLAWPDGLRPQPQTGYPCTACGKVYKGEKYDAAVRREMHMCLAYAVLHLGIAYQVEGDQRYAAKAAEILRKYAAVYPGPHTSLTEGGIIYQSLCESMWVIPLASGYDLVCDSGDLTGADKRDIESKLFRPVADGLMACGIPGNWGSWHLSAVGVVGFAIRDQDLIEYAVRSFKSQIANQLGDDGLWPESVHTYHFYPLTAFLYLAEAARLNGVDLYSWEAKPGKGLKAMFTAPLGYAYPNFQLPAINDGWYEAYLPVQMYDLVYSRYGDEALKWAVVEGSRVLGSPRAGIWSLLHGASLNEPAKAPRIESVDFPVLGIAVLRSRSGSVATFDYGPHLGHGQLDKMGLTLFAGGRLWAGDYGTPGYGSAMLPWYTGTPAHNTVVVDGKNQQPTKERLRTLFAGGPALEVAEAETREAYPGVLHRRSVVRAGDDFVVVDTLESDSEHTYDLFFRSEGGLSVGLSGEDADEAPSYDHVTARRIVAVDGPWRAVWKQGGKTLSLDMPLPGSSTVSDAVCPAETDARKVGLVICRKTGRRAQFVSVLCVRDRGCEPKVRFEDGLIAIRDGSAETLIFTGSREAGAPLETDGQYALVRTRSGNAELAAVVGGRTVRWQGAVVLSGTGTDRWYQKPISATDR